MSGSAEDSVPPLPTDDVAWAQSNLLSLDGGGVRGLWTLLALERLFLYIAEEEEEKDNETYTSFHPQGWPDNVSQAPLTGEEKREIDREHDPETIARKHPFNRRYLPCHYFDHICGSSTGGLIAIMLGRFRMTIADCIFEYQTLAQEVFGNPRRISTLRIGLGVRPKYKAERLVNVFKDVSVRRNEQPEPGEISKITFAYSRGLCATFVTTMKNGADFRAPHLHLIRSYDHHERHLPNRSTGPTPRSTMRTGRTNTGESLATNTNSKRANSNLQVSYGQASHLEVWEVARAATAAKFYFEPLEIEDPSGRGSMTFTDAGIGLANNPTQIAKQEIERLRGAKSVGIVVSVGTARKLKEDAKKATFWSTIPDAAREFADGASDPEVVHETMQNDHEKNKEFPYYRLNYPGGLQSELDEWEPKRTMFKKKGCGEKTMEAIQTAFNNWLAQVPSNSDRLKKCAAALVKCRRERMNTSKWERYATGSHYECRAPGCDPGDFFESFRFERHLKEQHQFEGQELKDEIRISRKRWRYQAAPNRH